MTKISKKIGKMWKDVTGVSPIIAVILMVAITVVLAATIYVWVSGFGGGGGGSAISLSLKQVGHGSNYVLYKVQSVQGNPGWEDLQATIGGNSATIYGDVTSDGVGTATTGEINAGDYMNITISSGTVSVGDTVTIIDAASGSTIFSATVTYA